MTSALLARLAGRPLALAPRALDGLLALPPEARGLLPEREGPEGAGYSVTEDGIAVVPVLGPLLTRGDWLTALLGATDYGAVGETIAAAFADSAARAVLLELDSPGGEVGGLFDLVDWVGALRENSGKPLWAVAGETALSAAFAVASAADRIYVTRTAEVGSVGIVAAHVDESAADAMAGRKWTLVHAGARKVDGNGHEPLSGTALADTQADVDALHAELVALIAENRGMSPDTVRATEAAIYRGQRGIAAGLADRLGTVGQALADLAAALDPPPARAARPVRILQPKGTRSTMTKETATTPAASDPAPAPPDPAQAPAAPDATPAEPATPVAPQPASAAAEPTAPATALPAEDPAERLRAEYAEIAAIAAQAGRLGVAVDAADAMQNGVAPAALRRSVLDALASRAEASAVVAAAPRPTGAAPEGADSPIVRRARERAAATRS